MLDRRPAVTTVMAVAGLDPAGPAGVAALDEALAAGRRPGRAAGGALPRVRPPADRGRGGGRPVPWAAPGCTGRGGAPGVAGMRHRLAAARATTPAWPPTPARRGRPRPNERVRSAARLWAEVARVAPARRDCADAAAGGRPPPARPATSATARGPRATSRPRGRAPAVVPAGPAVYVLGPRREAEGHLDRAWRQVDAGDDQGPGGAHRRACGRRRGGPGRRGGRYGVGTAGTRAGPGGGRRLQPRRHAGPCRARAGGRGGARASTS